MTKKNFTFLTTFLCSILFISACSSKDSDPTPSGSKTVTYKIIGSEGVNIMSIVYYSGTSPVSKSGDFGTTWTSDPITSNVFGISISANAIGPSDNSTLKAQILENGKVIKENEVSTGKALSTTLSLN